MDDNIRISIDSKKNAILNTYYIDNNEIDNKIEDLFKRIEEFASTCSDIQDFETKFATSPLNQEYTNIFTEVATKCPLKITEDNPIQESSSNNELLDDLTHPMKTQLYQKKMDFLRGLPVVGDIMEVKQHKDMLDKITGKNKEE